MGFSKNIFSFLFAFLFFAGNLVAQDGDSLRFRDAHWSVHRVARHVKLVTHQFTDSSLFRSNQNISYLMVRQKGCSPKFAIAAEPKRLRTTSDFATSHKALAAINGNFFDVKNGGAVSFVKLKHKVINPNRDNKRVRSFHQKAAVAINRGRVNIKKWDGSTDWEQRLADESVMLNGPLLRFQNQAQKLDSVTFNVTRHPRTCLGITGDGNVILFVADGRNAKANGLTLFELQKIMQWLGCETALNFDGGGSSTLWVRKNGVINYPCDNKKWDHAGERPVANILYIRKKGFLNW